METSSILAMFIALILGTQLCRFIPEFLPKKVLESPVLQKLNRMLPLAILILLVLTSINLPHQRAELPLFLAQVLALVLVVVSYQKLKNTFLSVALGIAGLNGVLWIMG